MESSFEILNYKSSNNTPIKNCRRSSLDYSRPETAPMPIGLYELKRHLEQDDEEEEESEESYENYNFDDDELSDITCSPRHANSSEGNCRWKSEHNKAASQMSLASIPTRSSSPERAYR